MIIDSMIPAVEKLVTSDVLFSDAFCCYFNLLVYCVLEKQLVFNTILFSIRLVQRVQAEKKIQKGECPANKQYTCTHI